MGPIGLLVAFALFVGVAFAAYARGRREGWDAATRSHRDAVRSGTFVADFVGGPADGKRMALDGLTRNVVFPEQVVQPAYFMGDDDPVPRPLPAFIQHGYTMERAIFVPERL